MGRRNDHKQVSALEVLLTTALVIGVAVAAYFARNSTFGLSDWLAVVGVAAATVTIGLGLLANRAAVRSIADEAQARERVRRAEDDLAGALRRAAPPGESSALADPFGEDQHQPSRTVADEEISLNEPNLVEPSDERLTLAALWDLTHGRLDYYHQIVTGQARRSFIAAQVAMAVGFAILVAFAILAVEAKTTAAAISAGGLGAVGAAFSGYLGKTLIRSQETAANHLRAYFDQPLELSRYLAAERLLADAGDLTPEQRAVILGSLVQAIASAGTDAHREGNSPVTG